MVEVRINSASARPNTLLTYWSKRDVDLAAGLDFGPNGNIFESFTYLRHAPFGYTINVQNVSNQRKSGLVVFSFVPRWMNDAAL